MPVNPESSLPTHGAGLPSFSPSSPFNPVALAIHANGYSVLPIMPGDKAPGAYWQDEWRPMRQWSQFCTEQPSYSKVLGWLRYPDANVGVACGRGVLAFDIDREDMVEPILAVLPPVMVAKKGRKGLTVFYRGDTNVIRSRGFKIDGFGVMDLISDGKQTVLPPSIHPDTGLPYEWTTERTLADTRPDELPECTAAQFEVVLDVLRAHGWEEERVSAPKPFEGTCHGSRAVGIAPISSTRALNDAALANLDAWVPRLGLARLVPAGAGYRSVAEWRPSNSGKPIGKRRLLLSINPKGIVDYGDGDRGYTPLNLVMAACRLEIRESVRWLSEQVGFVQEIAEPTPTPKIVLLDNRRSLEEASTALKNVIGVFFQEAVLSHWEEDARQLGTTPARDRPLVSAASPPPAWALRVETGGGKTHYAAESTAHFLSCLITDFVKAHPDSDLGQRPIIYFVPTIKLAEEVSARLTGLSIRTRVLRGYTRLDPERPDSSWMCLDKDGVVAAIDAGLPIAESLCRRKSGAITLECPLIGQCGKERERRADPQVWIIANSLSYLPRPKHIRQPIAVIFDESFVFGGVPKERKGDSGDNTSDTHGIVSFSLDEILAEPIDIRTADGKWDPEASNDLEILRARLTRALRAAPDGYLSGEELTREGLNSIDLKQGATLDWRRVVNPIFPGQPAEDREQKFLGAVESFWRPKAFAELWHALRKLLEGECAPSERLILRYNTKRKDRHIEHRPMRQVHASWSEAPALILDATLPSPEILQLALGRPVKVKADIAVRFSKHVHVTQVVEAPVSGRALALTGNKANRLRNPLNVEYLLHYIWERAPKAHPHKVAVVMQAKLEAILKARGLPANVETGHFNALAGLDKWKGVAGFILIGRTLPKVRDAERMASIMAGRAVEVIAPDDKGRVRFPRVAADIRVEGGHLVQTFKHEHPDPLVEAIRWQICEGEIIQAVGRVRALRRTMATSAFIDILTDDPLPLYVNDVVRWENLPTNVWAKIAADGVHIASRAHVRRLYPNLTEDQARAVAEGFPGETLIGSPIIGKTPGNRTARFKEKGKGKRWIACVLLPHGPQTKPAFEQWLRARGFDDVDIEVDRLPAMSTWRGQRKLAQIAEMLFPPGSAPA